MLIALIGSLYRPPYEWLYVFHSLSSFGCFSCAFPFVSGHWKRFLTNQSRTKKMDRAQMGSVRNKTRKIKRPSRTIPSRWPTNYNQRNVRIAPRSVRFVRINYRPSTNFDYMTMYVVQCCGRIWLSLSFLLLFQFTYQKMDELKQICQALNGLHTHLSHRHTLTKANSNSRTIQSILDFVGVVTKSSKKISNRTFVCFSENKQMFMLRERTRHYHEVDSVVSSTIFWLFVTNVDILWHNKLLKMYSWTNSLAETIFRRSDGKF